MEKTELTCFQLISNAGMAKSSFMEAISLAEKNDFENAENKMKEGSGFLIAGHTAHAGMIQKKQPEKRRRFLCCLFTQKISSCLLNLPKRWQKRTLPLLSA